MKLYNWNGTQMSLKEICHVEGVAYPTLTQKLASCNDIEEAVLAAKAAKVRGHRGAYVWRGKQYNSISDIANAANVWHSDLLNHHLLVGNRVSTYTARFNNNGHIMCRRVIKNG